MKLFYFMVDLCGVRILISVLFFQETAVWFGGFEFFKPELIVDRFGFGVNTT
jgi:hypothetical protein